MNVVVAGPGLMGAQIGAEYALGRHRVVFLARDAARARGRIAAAFQLARDLSVYPPPAIAAASDRVSIVAGVDELEPDIDLVIESIAERLAEKVTMLRALASLLPRAILASNTSSLSITEIGEGAGAPGRMIGTHYWNPPLLMPLVEVIRTDRTDPAIVTVMTETLTDLGKRPILAERDVPGFIWNRMQLALLREAVWLAENGVASPEAIDQVVREGLARRWRYTGPFQTAALGGAATFERIAENLWPVLSNADQLAGLRRWLNEDPEVLGRTREQRDTGLRDDLRRDQARAAPQGENDES
ncbi:MAG: 3-hydroxyacyl-CoA dehydrogenase family protein [Chloroflexota bacterium]|nr:3-hydroxyacyl-CoA dehydrogenase family protein [Chloroflexota bacterium]